MAMKQKDAVYTAVINLMGKIDGVYTPSKEQRSTLIEVIVTGIKSGDIEFGKTDQTDVQIRAYSSGLLSNWLKKDVRLNGGTKHVVKNPGSRAGSKDPQIVEMRKLRALMVGAGKDVSAIDQAIAKRVGELKPKTTVTINAELLPESLRDLMETAIDNDEEQ